MLQVTCERKRILGALTTVAPAIPGRATLPVLTHVLLEEHNGNLSVTGTDLQVAMHVALQGVPAPRDSGISVPHRLLRDVLAAMPDGAVTLTSDDKAQLTVTNSASRYTIHGSPAAEFPAIPPQKGGATLAFEAGQFARLVNSTLFAASQDEGRRVLMGCHLISADGKAIMAATDTHRLAVNSVPACELADPVFGAIIPGRSLRIAQKVVGDAPAVLTVCESLAHVACGEVALTVRLIEGDFPKWERVVPTSNDASAKCDRRAMLEAIRRVGIVARAANNKTVFQFEPGQLTISASAQDIGNATETVTVDYTGDPLAIAFNCDYVEDAFSVTTDDTVEIRLGDARKPALIVCESAPDFRCVVMPMALDV